MVGEEERPAREESDIRRNIEIVDICLDSGKDPKSFLNDEIEEGASGAVIKKKKKA